MFLVLLTMLTGPSDMELVRRFKNGDRGAYAEIVRRYQNRVFTLCVRWLGEEQVAEEVAQDVFIALFRSLAEFRGDAQLSTWIYRVAINHCKNRRLYRFRRASDRHDPLDGDPSRDDEAPRQIASDGPGTDVAVHRSEAEKLVNDALEVLDSEDKAIIVMRDVDDLSYEEISEILSLPRGTVKSRLHRARAELAKILCRKMSKEDAL